MTSLPVLAVLALLPQEAPPAPACVFSVRDQAWVERALAAWHFASKELAGISSVPRFRAILFDAACVRTSDDALVTAGTPPTWSSAPHAGTIALPDGGEVPLGVTSFTKGSDGLTYFTMSTPSVWSAAGVGRGTELENTMVGVMLHESSHVAQIGPYGQRLGALIEHHALPDSFNDNAVQERFRANPEFSAAIGNEIRLFAQAWAAEDEAEARYLASEARESMRARAARWFVGDDAYLAEAEDLWLTFEGSGQWLAYRWMTDTRGGGVEPADVLPRFTGDSQWSQAEGFALVLALDRFTASDWRKHAFGDGAKTVLEMLDAALAE